MFYHFKKLQLMQDHFNQSQTFRELPHKYQVSYSTARRICLDYEIFEEESLISKQGQHSKKKQWKGNWC